MENKTEGPSTIVKIVRFYNIIMVNRQEGGKEYNVCRNLFGKFKSILKYTQDSLQEFNEVMINEERPNRH